jgi:transposase
MRGRPLHIEWRTEDTPETLHVAYRAERDPLIKPRLQALWMLRTGHQMVQVAEHVDFCYCAVQKWLGHYRRRGLTALFTRPVQPPPPQHLTDAQWEVVREHLRRGTTRTLDQLRRWILRELTVDWSYSGLRKAMSRQRLALKVPRPRHEKTDRAAQAAWRKGGSPPPSPKPSRPSRRATTR